MAKGNHSHLGENMRNVQFKSRTFVLVGIVLIGFSAFSYWGLSTQNSDLLVKIEQLEDNIKIGSRRQRDLEDDLQAAVKKSNELQKTNAKLQSELQQKENLITAQGEEGAQWRDKVRNAESEVVKFKALIADKTKELSDLKEQISSHAQDLLQKDSKLTEAQELINKLKSLSGSQGAEIVASQLPNVQNQTSSSSSSAVPAEEEKHVLAKPGDDKTDDDKKPEKRAESEPVGAKPEDSAAVVKAEEEMELVNPKENALEQPDPDNDEEKFKEIREEMDIGEPDNKNNANDEKSKENNEVNDVNNEVQNVIKEPSLINSQVDNLDEEPALIDAQPRNFNPRFRNFNPLKKNKEIEENQPEDQEIENEHEDDRGDK